MPEGNLWDREADKFDEAPDHGLRDPAVRARWKALISRFLPAAGTALDIGCGTGTLSILMSELGLAVTGLDSSKRMLQLARQKAARAGATVTFVLGDADGPAVPAGSFDVLLCRHVLWTLPNVSETLVKWSRLIRPTGRFILIEGYWHTQVGLHQHEVEAALPAWTKDIKAEDLSRDNALWGGPVTDERFVVIADFSPGGT